jgi:uncharacterized protein with FMN-binding domain
VPKTIAGQAIQTRYGVVQVQVVVSGATYTSQGYLQSLQSALDQAGIK